MLKPILFVSIASLICIPAFAQDIWDDYSPWENTLEGEVILALASNNRGDDEERVLGHIGVTGKSTYIFESGLIIGGVAELAVQKDHPTRPGFAGNAPGYTAGPQLQSAYSGLSSSHDRTQTGPRAQLEKAYLSVEGGYGEIRAGRDEGVAKRFHEGPTQIMTAVRAANPRLDPTGLLFARTDHDITGPSAKLLATTPRILGVKAGVSFTPTADVRGLDRNVAQMSQNVPEVHIEDTVEVALNATRRLPKSGLRVRAAAAWSRADVSSSDQNVTYGRMETRSAGASIAGDTWSVGVDHVNSDNGISPLSGEYTATTIGATKQIAKVTVGVYHACAEDSFVKFESKTTSLELGYQLSDELDLGIAYQNIALNSLDLSQFQPNLSRTKGLVVEITRKF